MFPPHHPFMRHQLKSSLWQDHTESSDQLEKCTGQSAAHLYKIRQNPEAWHFQRWAWGEYSQWLGPPKALHPPGRGRNVCLGALGELSGKDRNIVRDAFLSHPSKVALLPLTRSFAQCLFSQGALRTRKHRVGEWWQLSPSSLYSLVRVLSPCDFGQLTPPLWTLFSYLLTAWTWWLVNLLPTSPAAMWHWPREPRVLGVCLWRRPS